MGRLAWYAGASTALAAGAVVSAFNQRANFYSACVYLQQSNLCLMVLINLILFIYSSFMYGLQRLCYGSLRPIEIEQLYEKGWFAVTETCLAMTIFREEVGPWFLVMFVALLTGKVWGWIGDGRVEILEQQPPANPRLFHFRLSISLALSVLYDIWMMSYIVNTVIQQARPNMMVMFLFEFTILTTSSFSTAFRYCIALIEARIVKNQTSERLIERRREVREERAGIIRQREEAAAAALANGEEIPQSADPLPSEDDVDEMDVEVPGWEAKGQWVLTLDLITDFIKLGIYLTFFCILMLFYGIPIHIMRDLFMTTRSFIKRLTAFIKYRRATQDMNNRYEDATAEELQREDTCIICREEMRPWSVTNPQAPAAAQGAPQAARPAGSVNERSRPKKLPCGHILHLGCLKSWLERQQICPTCRANVGQPQPPLARTNNANPPGAQGPQPPIEGQQDGPAPPPAAGRGGRARGMRMLNFGPLRVGFGQANLQDMAQGFGGQPGQDNAVAGGARVYGLELGFPRRQQPQPQDQSATNTAGSNSLQDQLQQIEQHIVSEIRNLQVTQQELQLVQLLQVELARLRLMQNGATDPLAANFQMPQMPQLGPLGMRQTARFTTPFDQMQRYGARPNTSAIPAGSADLPLGVTIPEGWSLLPLQRLDGSVTQAGTVPASNVGVAPTATTQQVPSPMPGISNNTSTPILTANPENHSQTSSVDSSDTNAIHTPPSVIADQSTSQSSASDTTLRGNMPTASTPATLATSGPSVLPGWGSSQLFPGSSLTGNTNSEVANPAPPPISGDGGSSMDVGQSSSSAQDSEERKDKGKAKAVTVEDTIDESEGV